VLGTQVEPGDVVLVDGAAVGPSRKQHSPVYIALNKPRGITCTTERHVRGNIVDFVAHSERIFPIGRLDKDSEGLILLTNDGDIVNEVLRVEHGHAQVARVARRARGREHPQPHPEASAAVHGEEARVDRAVAVGLDRDRAGCGAAGRSRSTSC
jgi:16S rRNA U516 pseudouridylate synthase RsuA-like enzyme